MIKRLLLTAFLTLTVVIPMAAATSAPRPDGRATSTRGLAENLMRFRRPIHEFDSTFTPAQYAAWKKDLKQAMKRLMRHPESQDAEPKKICSAQRDGYRIEKMGILSSPRERSLILSPHSRRSR